MRCGRRARARRSAKSTSASVPAWRSRPGDSSQSTPSAGLRARVRSRPRRTATSATCTSILTKRRAARRREARRARPPGRGGACAAPLRGAGGDRRGSRARDGGPSPRPARRPPPGGGSPARRGPPRPRARAGGSWGDSGYERPFSGQGDITPELGRPRTPTSVGRRPHLPAFPRLTTSNSRQRSAWTAAHGLCHTRDMTIKRLDHVSVVVDDLAAAIAFFTALGMTLEGEMPVEGPWLDRVNGLESVQVDIVMMRTPDGHGRLELTKFRNPKLVEIEPAIAPPNTLGLRRVMFTVESVDDTVARLRANGAELVGEVAQYEDKYRLCYMRGPAGIIVALAEELRA